MTKEKLITLKDRILSPSDSSYADDQIQVLNHCDTFGVFDRWGDILPLGKGLHGLYYRDTRFVNRLEMRINGHRPILLSSNIKEENEIISVDLTNPEIELDTGIMLPGDSVHFLRSQFVRDNLFHEELRIENFYEKLVNLHVTIRLEGDFRDIFEVKGSTRVKRGEQLEPQLFENRQVILSYQGLDHQIRYTEVTFSEPFENFNRDDSTVSFRLALEPGKPQDLKFSITFRIGKQNGRQNEDFHAEIKRLNADLRYSRAYFPVIETSNEQFSHWTNRSLADLITLMADTPFGKYPYAGIPWFNTAFGRDGIITAMETLWLAPELSRNVLKYLAASQADSLNPDNDAEPGKIFHETRSGEMVMCHELPFDRYYGTVDATPLFVMLAGEYYERTGDLETIKELWDSIVAAMGWIDTYGDTDGDGFVEYHHKAKNGIRNQGWKDSDDSVSHSDGRLAEPPIALSEVQGYVYSARMHASRLAMEIGKSKIAGKWQKQAESLKIRFNETFWDEELGSYILALDGEKNPCRVVSSNAGQVLFTRIADQDKAEKQVRTLMKSDMFTGWGIRTLSKNAKRYNPMSYHNGSVWPHDVALIARGMAVNGFKKEAMQLLTGLFNASLFIPLQRMPELFCGFERRKGEAPTSYPVACSPQAWSVAAVFCMLEAILQIQILPLRKEIIFHQPFLPSWMESLCIRKLNIGNSASELQLSRQGSDEMVGINWRNKPDGWSLVVIK